MSTLIASYANLQTEIENFMARSDLTTHTQTFILLGEKRIHREVRCPDMEAAFSTAISSGVVAVPTGFLEWKAAYIDSNGANLLEPVTWGELLARYPTRSSDSLPKVIAQNVTNFEFGPYPDSTYTVKGTYYKRPTTVSSSWNTLATNNPDLYLYASLAATAAYVNDDARVPLWETAYVQTRDALNSEGARQTISGAAIRMTPR